jgi:hypothetical protein
LELATDGGGGLRGSDFDGGDLGGLFGLFVGVLGQSQGAGNQDIRKNGKKTKRKRAKMAHENASIRNYVLAGMSRTNAARVYGSRVGVSIKQESQVHNEERGRDYNRQDGELLMQ